MTDPRNQLGAPEDVETLRQHFLRTDPANHVNAWESCWQRGVTPWDKLKPNPALYDTLDQKSSILGPSTGPDGQRKRALVPGCGAGYDVWLLSGYGYDVYGLDSSPSAIQRAPAVKENPKFLEMYPTKDADAGRGEANFVLADFFKDDFFAETKGGSFDLIYDYTFLCALPPSLRPSWSKRMAELLGPGGHLICNMFPLQKPPKTGGPPFGLSPVLYQQLLGHPGDEVEYDEEGWAVAKESKPNANALEKVDEWKAERTLGPEQNGLRISIWRKPQ